MPIFELTSECYVVEPSPGGDPVIGSIAYFPLQSLVLSVNGAAAEILGRLQVAPIECEGETAEFCQQLVKIGVVNGRREAIPNRHCVAPEHIHRALLLTSDRCSLACRYCYGSASASGDLMSSEIAAATVDYLVENAVRDGTPQVDVGFHGGGEPTMNWSVLTGAIQRVEERCAHHHLRLRSSLCTNGMLNEAQVSWIAQHIDSVVLSIDGPPEIHDAQRPTAVGGPSFDYVASSADRLAALGKRCILRVTATSLSEDRLAEIYDWLADRFRPHSICVEPLFSCGRCSTSNIQPPSAESFVRQMSEVRRRARPDVPAVYSGGRLESLTDRFCGAAGSNFFVTARGDVTTCVEVTSPTDPRASLFFIGKWDPSTRSFVFDRDRHQRLCAMTVTSVSACAGCFARWHCAGDCPAKMQTTDWETSPRSQYRCSVNRAITRGLLTALAERTQLSNKVTP